LATHVSFKSAFGIDIAPHGSKNSLAEAATSFLKAAGHLEGPYVLLHVAFPPLAPLVRRIANLFPTPTYAAGLSGRRTIESTVSKLVMDRYGQAKECSACNGSESALNLAQHLSITSNDIKQTGYIKNDADIVCQGSNFVLAAYETTSSTLAFAIHLLSTHPAVQEVAMQEVDTLKKSHITDPKDFLNNCPFIVAVVKETLRLYPAVPLAIRQADKEMTLRSGKNSYCIPKGTHLAISIYGMHRDASIWRDPDEFRPARFHANTATTATTGLAYMPFGDGVRCCIGEKYAMQECVIMLVKLLSAFRFENVESKRGPYGQQGDIETSMSLSLTPKNGVWVRVVPRKA
jgi:cytochrome P450